MPLFILLCHILANHSYHEVAVHDAANRRSRTIKWAAPAAVGAYVIGKGAGQVNIGLRIAIRVSGPDGDEPRLTIFSLENTEGSSLVGTAKDGRRAG